MSISHAELHERVERGFRLFQQQRFGEAEALLRAAQDLDHDNADIAYHLGNTLARLGRLPEAVVQLQRCIASRPQFAPALNNLGIMLRKLGQLPQALEAFAAALRLRPDAVIAIASAGLLLHDLGRLDEAEQMLRRGIQIDPRYATLHLNLGIVLKDSGDAAGAVAELRTACELDPVNAHAHGVLLYTLSFVCSDPNLILAEALRWQLRHGLSSQALGDVRPRTTSASDRVRIGYMSPDFRDHCQALYMLPLLSHHDRAGFEITCFSLAERPDDYTRRLREQADQWIEVANMDDDALATCIRACELDILVDLTMHMGGGRPQVLARKPAPLQIAWLAYPGTAGLQAIDYRLSDPRLDPEGTDCCYTERTLRLPDSFWCYDPLSIEPAPNSLPAQTKGYLTLGCLNNPCKLTDATLQLWAPALNALPQAQLLLLAPAGAGRARLRARFERLGITGERLHFIDHQPRSEYLRSYHRIDFCLDTQPYNGHTTSLDALWMGVPVITRIGDTCAGRAGLSQLYQLGLTELAAATDGAFTDLVIALASDLPRLATLRAQLRQRMMRSPLMDAARFARNLEALYRQALATHRTHEEQ